MEGLRGERAPAAARVPSPKLARLVPRQGRHQLLRGVMPGGQDSGGDEDPAYERRVRQQHGAVLEDPADDIRHGGGLRGRG